MLRQYPTSCLFGSFVAYRSLSEACSWSSSLVFARPSLGFSTTTIHSSAWSTEVVSSWVTFQVSCRFLANPALLCSVQVSLAAGFQTMRDWSSGWRRTSQRRSCSSSGDGWAISWRVRRGPRLWTLARIYLLSKLQTCSEPLQLHCAIPAALLTFASSLHTK